MSEWKETNLGEICSDISYGYTASAKAEASGPKFLRITDIVPDRINWETVPYCDADAATIEKYKLQNGDIVIARTGATTGYNKIIKNIEFNAVFASYLIRYKIDKEKAYPYYIGHVLQSSNWYDYVDAIAGGSAQPGANAKELASFEILLPPLPEQRAIASVLSSLDDKIDLLHRQNKTLEAMAETLFRQWFVEEAEEGWDEGLLDDILSVKGGTTPSTKNPEFWDGEIHWTTPRDLSNINQLFLLDTLRKITDAGLKKIGSGLLPKGTLLLSSRAPVGYLAFSEIPIAINQGYIAIIDDKGFSIHFIYLWLKQNMNYVKSYANGSTFQEISKTSFKSLEVLIPPENLREQFEEIVTPYFEKIRINMYQTRSLEKLRDTLLPKLMRGEVGVEYER